jgi:hypothetical protein
MPVEIEINENAKMFLFMRWILTGQPLGKKNICENYIIYTNVCVNALS